ncbi:hypothetical protein PR202_ga19215 [Eleusine coracana subsp. coracana]|uniref:Uncharacterized protein n=1 Tax=Eleusine coracana subsp. coracana TaxID=191504 RepID=A0AAV5CV13_ELECO|nr:hypothetical protein PR202_ga19215 [Eleusine coracana subsp. coracana]
MVHATGSTAQGRRSGGSLRGTGAGCSDGARSGRHAIGGGWHGVVAVCLRDVVRASRLLRRRTRRATVHHATRHASGWCAGQEQDARTSVAKREQLAAVPAACAAARLYGLARQARKAGGGRK